MKLLNKLYAKIRQFYYRNWTLQKWMIKLHKNKAQPPVIKDNSKQFEKLLNNLKQDRATLSIKFEHAYEPYVSILLDVDMNREFLIIDEINSSLGHHLACTGDPFVISAKDNGVNIFFHSKVIDFSTIDGISFYRIPFPNHIEYLQRRTTSRLIVPADVAITVDFFLAHHGIVRANIQDISLRGLRFALSKNVKRIFDRHHKLDHCRIISPFLPPTEFSLEIKSCRYDLDQQKTLLGCQFASLDGAGLKFLSVLCNHLKMPMH